MEKQPDKSKEYIRIALEYITNDPSFSKDELNDIREALQIANSLESLGKRLETKRLLNWPYTTIERLLKDEPESNHNNDNF